MTLHNDIDALQAFDDALTAIVARHYPQAERECFTRIPLTLIQICAAHVCGVTPRSMLSHKRQQELIEPRHIAMYLATELTSGSLSQIGRRFHRDHSTVLIARNKVSQRIASDAHFAAKVNDIRTLFKAVHDELRELASSDTRARTILAAA